MGTVRRRYQCTVVKVAVEGPSYTLLCYNQGGPGVGVGVGGGVGVSLPGVITANGGWDPAVETTRGWGPVPIVPESERFRRHGVRDDPTPRVGVVTPMEWGCCCRGGSRSHDPATRGTLSHLATYLGAKNAVPPVVMRALHRG
eukprot:767191-Hanusia_phi.AAC.1